jgi:site-specific DNA-methyltransferase (adenine-specific)
MSRVPAGSVDAIICDLPYGTTACAWDSVIPFDVLWAQYWRVIKPNGAVILTSAQPFTSVLNNSCIENFKYDWIWHKTKASGHLNAKIMPMRAHEHISVFCRVKAPYFPQGLVQGNFDNNRPAKGQQRGEVYGYQRNDHANASLTGYPRSVLTFEKPHKPIHPTQKPVALMEYLIRTYTNPGDTVLDNTMGSGTTGVAAVQTGRNFIGIERDPEYFAICQKRIGEARPPSPVVDLAAFRRVAEWNAAVSRWRAA